MECPKCGHVQADGPQECAKCGLLFARWVERRSTAAFRPPRSTRSATSFSEPEEAKASTLGLLLGGIGTLFLGLASWLFWFGNGLPVDREAYRDVGAGFAVVLPSGWSMVTPANAASVLKKAEGRYPEAVEQAMQNGRAIAAFFLPGEIGALAPWGTITLVDGVPSPLREEDQATLAAAATGALAAKFEDYRPGDVSITPVDRLMALNVAGGDTVKYLKSPSQEVRGELPGGRRFTIGRTEEIWDTFDRTLEHWLIPGRDRSFVVAFGSPDESLALHAGAFEQIVGSFRVSNRPHLYGPAGTAALRAAATVLLAAVLLYTLTEAAALLRKR